VKVTVLEGLDQELYNMTAIGFLNLVEQALTFVEGECFS
jgi:hypothetical protein